GKSAGGYPDLAPWIAESNPKTQRGRLPPNTITNDRAKWLQKGVLVAALPCSRGDGSRRLHLGLQPAAIDQHLRDLHRVERGAFAQIIGHHPKVDAVVDCRIFANSRNVGRALSRRFVGGDVTAGLPSVDNQASGRTAQNIPRLVGADRINKFDVDGLRVADEHGHPDAGRSQLDLGVEDFLGLGDHLPLFLGRAAVHEHIDLRNYVERDSLWELLRFDRVGYEYRARLREQFVHRLLAGAGDRLIGRDHHAPDCRAVVQGLQRHDELSGRAVGVGADVLLAEPFP